MAALSATGRRSAGDAAVSVGGRRTGIEVRFDDGRFFHRFAGAERPEAAHDCAPDVYRVPTTSRDWPRWRADWRVTGPRKDYVMRTHYSR